METNSNIYKIITKFNSWQNFFLTLFLSIIHLRPVVVEHYIFLDKKRNIVIHYVWNIKIKTFLVGFFFEKNADQFLKKVYYQKELENVRMTDEEFYDKIKEFNLSAPKYFNCQEACEQITEDVWRMPQYLVIQKFINSFIGIIIISLLLLTGFFARTIYENIMYDEQIYNSAEDVLEYYGKEN